MFFISASAAARLDWMYQGQVANASSEEYLLGKEFKGKIEDEDVKKVPHYHADVVCSHGRVLLV